MEGRKESAGVMETPTERRACWHFSCSGPRSRSRSSRRVAEAPARSRQQPRSRRRSSARGRGSARSMPRRRRRLKHTLFKATLLPKDRASRNIASGRARSSRQEGQRGPGAQVLEEQRLHHRHEGQAHRRVHRAVRRERLPPDVEDGVHPSGADVSRGRQDHLLERALGLQQGVRRLEGGDRAGCRPDRHLSGLRRRDDPGDEGGDRRRNPRRDVCLGLRQRSRQELPDGRR